MLKTFENFSYMNKILDLINTLELENIQLTMELAKSVSLMRDLRIKLESDYKIFLIK